MLKEKIKIAMVSYTNTKPMAYGFLHHPKAELFKLNTYTPADCAKAFVNNEVDMALVPSAFLLTQAHFNIITDCCIGSYGPVNSMALLSNHKIEEIQHIILDDHSMTSNNLIKILMEKYWNKKVNFDKRDVNKESVELKQNEAVILIGDKVFKYQKQYKYKYDLGEIWNDFTGLPFVFAVWLAKDHVKEETIQALSEVLHYGINRIEDVLEELPQNGVDYREYLTLNLKYNLTQEYRNGLKQYLSYLS